MHAGLARAVSVKSLDYQEHVSEYGVHWNFFLTVAAMSALTGLVPVQKKHSIFAGMPAQQGLSNKNKKHHAVSLFATGIECTVDPELWHAVISSVCFC